METTSSNIQNVDLTPLENQLKEYTTLYTSQSQLTLEALERVELLGREVKDEIHFQTQVQFALLFVLVAAMLYRLIFSIISKVSFRK